MEAAVRCEGMRPPANELSACVQMVKSFFPLKQYGTLGAISAASELEVEILISSPLIDITGNMWVAQTY